MYKLPTDKSTIIIGESSTAYGVNDSLLTNAINLSQPADAYIYTYVKLKKILPLNSNIHTMVLSFWEQDVTQRLANLWLHNDSYMAEKIRNYFQLITAQELGYLFIHNPEEVIKDLAIIPKSNSALCYNILRSKKVSMASLKLGGYEVNIGNIA